MFWRNMSPPSSGLKSKPSKWLSHLQIISYYTCEDHTLHSHCCETNMVIDTLETVWMATLRYYLAICLERSTFSSEEWNFIERQQVKVSLSAGNAEPC
jgi:hypothetical protein